MEKNVGTHRLRITSAPTRSVISSPRTIGTTYEERMEKK
jgi:hypothetical protein